MKPVSDSADIPIEWTFRVSLGGLLGLTGLFIGQLCRHLGSLMGVAGGLWGVLGRLGEALGWLNLQHTHICEANDGSSNQLASPMWVR